mmetsp:Transcript_19541/g.42401  ORF Transcript_19541/g.42401 Transcript_19541/m.42401 type:complete len:116 (-) Transcript_19541:431-778(-)
MCIPFSSQLNSLSQAVAQMGGVLIAVRLVIAGGSEPACGGVMLAQRVCVVVFYNMAAEGENCTPVASAITCRLWASTSTCLSKSCLGTFFIQMRALYVLYIWRTKSRKSMRTTQS